MRKISILGATGSVGASTLDLIRRNRGDWRVVALTANCNVAELAALAREFDAEVAVVADESCLPDLRDALAGSGVEAAGGTAALREAAARPADIVMAAIVGTAGACPGYGRGGAGHDRCACEQGSTGFRRRGDDRRCGASWRDIAAGRQ